MVILYPMSQDELFGVYRQAFDSLDVRILSEDATAKTIRAESARKGFRSDLTVQIRPEATGARAAAVIQSRFTYSPAYRHYPYDLWRTVGSMLGDHRDGAEIVPFEVYPEGGSGCRDYPSNGSERSDPSLMEAPALSGGMQGLLQRIQYPREARGTRIGGSVFVRFVVDETGAIPCAEVITGLSGGFGRAALDAVIASEFKPGAYDGTPIPVFMLMPITFQTR